VASLARAGRRTHSRLRPPPAGRLGISDVIADDQTEPARRAEAEQRAGCLAGALTRPEYYGLLATVGFTAIRIITTTRPAGDGFHSAVVQAVKPDTPPRT
jgi:hypothetical protein